MASTFLENDFLGHAAVAKHAAYEAEKNGDFDQAWRLQHERRRFYLKHSQKIGYTKQQTLSLDAWVSKDLANVLRKESKHLDAFTHILYWATAQRHDPIKEHASKVRAYFNRSGIKTVSLEQVHVFISKRKNIDYSSIRDAVSAWASI